MKNKGINVYTFAANKFGNKSVNKVYLLLGGNQGNRTIILDSARKLLEENAGKINKISPMYETAAWGKTDQPNFLNQAIEINTEQNPYELLACMQQIETNLGRQRQEHWGQRTLDIDMLFFNNEIINSENLVVPHPEIQNRRFALVPLCDIAADFIHPILKLNIAQLVNNCSDFLQVNIYEGNQ